MYAIRSYYGLEQALAQGGVKGSLARDKNRWLMGWLDMAEMTWEA